MEQTYRVVIKILLNICDGDFYENSSIIDVWQGSKYALWGSSENRYRRSLWMIFQQSLLGAFTYSKLTIEALEQSVKCFQN